MYRVVIADDEYYVRKALINLVDWTALGFEVAGEAANGIDALQMVQQSGAAVLITDIRMPRLDGLKLIAEARKLSPSLECIIISGYDDFTYAKQAISLGVTNYLCKPVDAGEMAETLTGIRRKLRTAADGVIHTAHPTEAAMQHLAYLNMQQAVEQLLHTSPQNPFEGERFGVVMLCTTAGYAADTLESWMCRLTGITPSEETLPCTSMAQLLPDAPLRLRFIIRNPRLTHQDICDIARRIFNSFSALISGKVTCAYSHEPAAGSQLREVCEQVQRTLKSKLLLGRPFLSAADPPPPDPDEQDAVLSAVMAFRNALADRDAKQAHLQLLLLFALPIGSVETLEIAQRYIYDVICEYRLRYQATPCEIAPQLASPNNLYFFDTLEQYRSFLIPPVIDFFFHNESMMGGNIALQVQRYIRGHLSGDLRLGTLASHFYLSPSHLSFLFKKEVGYALSEYIENMRMERAKALLSTNAVSVSDIAQQTGYQNAAYFSRAFKKVTGMSPMRYQQLFRIGLPAQDVPAANDTRRMNHMELLNQISEFLQKGKAKDVKALVQQAIDEGVPAQQILEEGLLSGMSVIGEKFKNNEVFVPEVLVAARAMNMGVALLKPLLAQEGAKATGRACIGTVKGDLHDIGKNLVKMMMEGKGLEVIDLGTDVPAEAFIKAAVENDCQIICCSALLTTTMGVMGEVVKAAEAAGIRGKVKVMIGGAPVTEAFCKEIGADAYTPDAATAAEVAAGFCTKE